MTYRRLPPLNALKSFEAAARRLSFSQAAAELHVTPGAISRQVRELEQRLDLDLFIRRADGVELTKSGERLFRSTRAGLDAIAAGVLEAARAAKTARMAIGTNASFATFWLVPRLPRFWQRHPDLDFQLTTTSNYLDLTPHNFDVSIIVSDGPVGPGLVAEPVLPIEVTPVCSPRLIEEDPTFDLRRHRLLHIRPRPRDWHRWLAAAGIDGVDSDVGPMFDTLDNVFEAAAEGLGVALGIRGLFDGYLASGRLVTPSPVARKSSRSFLLVYERARRDEPRIAAFRRWIAEEAAVPPSFRSSTPERRRRKSAAARPR